MLSGKYRDKSEFVNYSAVTFGEKLDVFSDIILP